MPSHGFLMREQEREHELKDLALKDKSDTVESSNIGSAIKLVSLSSYILGSNIAHTGKKITMRP